MTAPYSVPTGKGLNWRSLPVIALISAIVAIAAWATTTAYANDYWFSIVGTVAPSILVLQSFGIISGRAGIIALCQMSFAGMGAWTTEYCAAHGLPGGLLVYIVIGALAASVFGALVGLASLRVRGAALGILTWMVAVAMDVVWGQGNFPMERSGSRLVRPEFLASDSAFLLLAALVAASSFVFIAWLGRTRMGVAWHQLRVSERGLAAWGYSVAFAKISAFTMSAGLAGIAGGLLAGAMGSSSNLTFASLQSLNLFSASIMVGSSTPDGVLFGGLLSSLLPGLLQYWSVRPDTLVIVFGLLAIFALAQGGGIHDMIHIKRNARHVARRQAAGTLTARPQADHTNRTHAQSERADEVVLRIRNLNVRFGVVDAVKMVDLDIKTGSVTALIGPNGAGKTSLINAVTGFVPATGSIQLEGQRIDGRPAHIRARHGMRRSFQTLRIPDRLTVGDYVRAVAGHHVSDEQLAAHLAWWGCPCADIPIGPLDVGMRRFVELAALTATRPKVLFLDEPAAGQSAKETAVIEQRISQIPKVFGSAVVLVEHDIELVRNTCDTLVVMNFGSILAQGEASAVLSDPEVIQAYLGAVGENAPVS